MTFSPVSAILRICENTASIEAPGIANPSHTPTHIPHLVQACASTAAEAFVMAIASFGHASMHFMQLEPWGRVQKSRRKSTLRGAPKATRKVKGALAADCASRAPCSMSLFAPTENLGGYLVDARDHVLAR